jgi:hypothetical protein
MRRIHVLLAEALASRKDSLGEIDDLRSRLAAAVLRYEDEDSPTEAPGPLLGQLGAALDRFESLSVAINQTNNATRLAFDGLDLSLMEAIAHRARLVLEVKARRGALEEIERATGSSRGGRRGWLDARRTKDQLRELPTVELQAERQAANHLSEAVRRLDLAMQQRNWTTELIG